MSDLGVILLNIFIALSYSATEARDEGFYLDLGHSYLNTDSTVGGVGYVYKNVDIHAGMVGHGQTDGRYQEKQYYGSITKILKTKWNYGGANISPYLGIAYTHGLVVCEDISFSIGLNIKLGKATIRQSHLSNAGAGRENTGLDFTALRIFL